MKIYKLINSMDSYPEEINIYNPRSDEDIPEWFSDILKFKKIEGESVEYFKSIDNNGSITYQVPSITGHICIPKDGLVARSIGTGEIFPMKESIFNSMYKEKISWKSKILMFLKSIFT